MPKLSRLGCQSRAGLDAKVKPASPKSSWLGRRDQAGLVGLNLMSSQAQAKPLQAKTKRLGSRLGLFGALVA
jgi:hypothetical protein